MVFDIYECAIIAKIMKEKFPNENENIVNISDARQKRELANSSLSNKEQESSRESLYPIEDKPGVLMTMTAERLDLLTQSAANVGIMLELLKKRGNPIENFEQIEEIMNEFKIGGKNIGRLAEAHLELSFALKELERLLRTQVGNEEYFSEVIPKTDQARNKLARHTKWYLTAGEEGEQLPLGPLGE